MLQGGMDQVTPTLSLRAGICRNAVNFEALTTGGYGRISGYERYDGRPSPSAATFSIVTVSAYANMPTVGQTLTGQTSGATGVVVYVDSSGFMGVTATTGAFAVAEVVKVGATVIGTTIANRGGINSSLNASILAAAANIYRANIGLVPGSGPVRGVWLYNSVLYAFRDNAGATATLLYKATTGGWVNVALGSYITYDTGTGSAVTMVDGVTVVGGTSGATGVVTRVVQQSGAWGTNSAGILVFTTITGTFQIGEAIKVSGSTVATCRSANIANALNTGGKFEFANANFSGALSTFRMYGCDGVNKAFEFDGTTFVLISTGSSPDAPKHLVAHKFCLFLSIQTSILFSAPGLPYNWTALSGAGTIAVGDTVTGLLEMPGSQTTGSLAVFASENTFMLYGTSSANWNFVTFNTGAGCIDYSCQNIDDAYVLDYRGIISLKATLNYGNFDVSTLSNQVRTFLLPEIANTSGSCINRSRSQYRLFFNDGYGLYTTMVNGNFLGAMSVYFPNPIYTIFDARTSAGTEVTFFGSTNGYVYQLDMGTSFDGAPISAFATLIYNSARTPRVLKRYRKAAVEISGPGYCSINFSYSLQYGITDYVQPALSTNYPSNFSSWNWDAFTWDAFIWDGLTLSPSECEMSGTAENVAITLSSNSDAYLAFALNSIVIHYTLRRALR